MAEKKTRSAYRIGDYARYMGVTPDFLKHYEQNGLLQAEHRPNGYRYFDFEDSARLLECMRLRNHGVVVRQMGALLDETPGLAAFAVLQDHVEAMRRRVERDSAVVAEFEAVSRWMAARRMKPFDWEVVQMEAAWFLPHSDGRHFLEDPQIYEVLPEWMDWMPVVRSVLRFSAAPQTPEDFSFRWGLGLRESRALRHGIPKNGAVEMRPAAKALRWHRAGALPRGVISMLADRSLPLFGVLDRLGLQPKGDGWMDILMTANRAHARETYAVFTVPVEED